MRKEHWTSCLNVHHTMSMWLYFNDYACFCFVLFCFLRSFLRNRCEQGFKTLIHTYLSVSIMHICTGCLTGEHPPNTERSWAATFATSIAQLNPRLRRSIWMTSVTHVFVFHDTVPIDVALFGIQLLSIRGRCPNHFSLRFLMKLVSWGCLITDLACWTC